jgi:diguanylate cyclase (GGDEF)-like protein
LNLTKATIELITSFFFSAENKTNDRDRMAVVIVLMNLVYSSTFFLLHVFRTQDNEQELILIGVSLFFYMISLLLIKLGRYTLAKIVYLLMLSLNITISTLYASTESLFHFFFLLYPIIIYTFFDFERKAEKLGAFFFISISPLLMIYLELSANTPIHLISPENIAIFRVISALSLFSGIVVAILVQAMFIFQAEKELKELASTDPLTSAENRRKFYEVLESELARVNRYGGKLAVAIMDLDDFKLVNDNHGHALGDEVLVKFSDVCRGLIRSTDHFARFGGDEFALLLVESDEKEAFKIADRIRQTIAEMRVGSENGKVKITTSIGIASLRQAAETVDEFVNRADVAMYVAKKAGGNKSELYLD